MSCITCAGFPLCFRPANLNSVIASSTFWLRLVRERERAVQGSNILFQNLITLVFATGGPADGYFRITVAHRARQGTAQANMDFPHACTFDDRGCIPVADS